MSTKKFNPNKCTLTEMNRELKRLASRKCRAKSDEAFNEAESQYKKLVAIKNKRFNTSRKSYITFTEAEISELDLETTIKAIKSLQSTRCLYPERKDEVLKVEQLFQAHRDEIRDRAELERLQKKLRS